MFITIWTIQRWIFNIEYCFKIFESTVQQYIEIPASATVLIFCDAKFSGQNSKMFYLIENSEQRRNLIFSKYTNKKYSHTLMFNWFIFLKYFGRRQGYSVPFRSILPPFSVAMPESADFLARFISIDNKIHVVFLTKYIHLII